jgi:hypothetical protein
MTALEDLENLLHEMKPVLLAAGIPERQLKIRKRPESKDYKTGTLHKAFDFLHEIKISPQYAKAQAAWKLLPPKTWHHYKILGICGLREQVILKTASQALLPLWTTKRPRIFGKEKPQCTK